jgi:hypothetical protein
LVVGGGQTLGLRHAIHPRLSLVRGGDLGHLPRHEGARAAALGLTEEVASSSPERVGLRLVVVDF